MSPTISNMFLYALLLVTVFAIHNSYEADILVIIPTPSFSHQAPLRSIWKELAKQGHNITLVTTDPMKDSSLSNIHEIDIGFAYQSAKKHRIFDIALNDSKSFLDMGRAFVLAHNEVTNTFFESPEGLNLIHNTDNHFDLLIVEAQLPSFMIFSWKYDIPFIGICSLDCAQQYHDTAGNYVHPVANPDTNQRVENPYKPTFWERLACFLSVWIHRAVVLYRLFPRERNLLKQHFGEDVPPLEQLQNRMSMMFVTTSPIFQFPRALMPNTISIGNGMHIEEQDLDADIQDFLDKAEHGAIYFSLGSNIKEKHLNDTTKNEIIKALASLPYRVLWKIDRTFESLPSNIRTSKWFSSQPDILRHPKVKVFITQGGLQSMQESVYFGKPLIGIPFFGDQYLNVNRMVQMGYGVKIDKHNLTETSLREAVEEVVNNPKYILNAQKYGEIFRDVDVPDASKAVWWTEYVLRHKGARHFRNPLLDMPFWKRHALDVYAITFLVIFVIYKIVALSFHMFVKLLRTTPKGKQD